MRLATLDCSTKIAEEVGIRVRQWFIYHANVSKPHSHGTILSTAKECMGILLS